MVQEWTRGLADGLAPSTTRVVFANLSSVFKAAMDDGLIAANPCSAGSVKPPATERRKVVPWTVERVNAVHSALPARFRGVVAPAAGGGLRQGEVFGLSPDDVDERRRVIHVRRQVKIVGAQLVFAPPKRNKARDVPLAEYVREELVTHTGDWQPIEVTLPWRSPDGPATTVLLYFTTREKGALNRNYFNRLLWKPSLTTAEVPSNRENGMHALRHFFASVVLDE